MEAAPKVEAFINNVDSYVGNALCMGLERTGKYRVSGTLQGGPGSQVPRNVKRIVTRMVPANLLRRVGAASLVVYDLHEADLEEVEFVYQGLQQGDFLRPLCVVLLSSVHTWASSRVELEEMPRPEPPAPPSVQEDGSKAEGEEDAEPVEPVVEEPPGMQPVLSSESQCDQRLAPAKYATWHALEQKFLSLNRKENVSAFVLAAGILYGQGELFLHDAFASALLDGGRSFRTIGPGQNFLPLAHVMDVASAVHRVGWQVLGNDEEAASFAAKQGEAQRYYVIQDRAHCTQREILTGIVNALGDPTILPLEAIEYEQAMLVDEATTLGGLNLRFELGPMLQDPAFPWWGTGSFLEDAAHVTAEFRECREIAPIQVCVCGPPGAGKTDLAQRLARSFRLAHVHLGGLISQAQQDAESELGKEVAEAGEARLSPELITKLVERSLGSNACSYLGFVLDGYPRSKEEAHALFIEVGEPPEGEEEAAPEERVKPCVPLVVYDLGFAAEEDPVAPLLARLRAEGHPELREGHNDEAGLRRRYASYSAAPARDFFAERLAERVVAVDAALGGGPDSDALYQVCAADLRARDLPFNYLEEDAAAQEGVEDIPVEAEGADIESVAAATREQEERVKLEAILERERELLIKQSGPLRAYLMQVVVPPLLEALMEVCHLQPADPVDYLAEYLFHAAVAHEELGPLPKAWRDNPWVEPVQQDG